MRSGITIAIILALVAFRFILPPFPHVIKTFAGRWGKADYDNVLCGSSGEWSTADHYFKR